MERSWSDAALDALESYPWATAREKERARAEAELVSFSERVEVDDLPLEVRLWLKTRESDAAAARPWVWKGESWKDLTEGFEREILSQALAANGGFVAKAARALGTTQRIVAYKARKYGISTKQSKQKE